MQSILVPVTSETDISLILNFFKGLGLKAMVLDETTRQMKARKALVAFNHTIKKANISDQEVIDEINEFRKAKNVSE